MPGLLKLIFVKRVFRFYPVKTRRERSIHSQVLYRIVTMAATAKYISERPVKRANAGTVLASYGRIPRMGRVCRFTSIVLPCGTRVAWAGGRDSGSKCRRIPDQPYTPNRDAVEPTGV